MAISLNNGDANHPSLYFASETNTGLYLRYEHNVGLVVDSLPIMAWDKESVSTTVQLRVTGGNRQRPSISFATDQNTGLYRVAEGYVGVSTNNELSIILAPASEELAEGGIDNVFLMTPLRTKQLINITGPFFMDRANHTGTQAITTVEGLELSLSEKAEQDHTHTWNEILSKPTTISGFGITDAFSGSYTDLSNIPVTFPPDAHNHDDRYYTVNEVNDLLANHDIHQDLDIMHYALLKENNLSDVTDVISARKNLGLEIGVDVAAQPTYGTTANRPVLGLLDIGVVYFDTTLGHPIWWDGDAWVDATGTLV